MSARVARETGFVAGSEAWRLILGVIAERWGRPERRRWPLRGAGRYLEAMVGRKRAPITPWNVPVHF